jgi:hypothetical protein
VSEIVEKDTMVTGIKNNVNHVPKTVNIVTTEEDTPDPHGKFSVKIVLIQNSCYGTTKITNVSMNAQIIIMLMSKREHVIIVNAHVLNVHLCMIVSHVNSVT